MSWKQWSESITMTITFSQKNERANQNTWVEHGLHWEQQKFSELFQGQKEIEKTTWVVCLIGNKPSTTWYEYQWVNSKDLFVESFKLPII